MRVFVYILFWICVFIAGCLLASGCGVVDKIERPRDVLWDLTPALKVTNVHKNKITLQNFPGTRIYYMKCDTLEIGDTLILTDNIRPWIK